MALGNQLNFNVDWIIRLGGRAACNPGVVTGI
jgi:hypothetical protein